LARNFLRTAALTAARGEMKHLGRLQLGLALLLVAGCGTGNTPAASMTSPSSTPSSATATASSSPTPPAALCTASNRCLALVTLRGSGQLVVRDLTDIDHPWTVAIPGSIPATGGFGESVAHFVSASQLSYPLDGGIMTTPLSGSPRTPVAGTADDASDPVWSPDGTAVVYRTVGGSVENGDE